MTSGSITWTAEYVGYSGAGEFIQSGGANQWNSSLGIMGDLFLGYNPGSSGTYTLSGTGVLSAFGEYVGTTGCSGLFQQNGGTNTVCILGINPTGRYKFTAGTLQVSGTKAGLTNNGIFDFDNGLGVLNIGAGCLVNLAMPGSSLLNTGSATLNVGTGSLLIVPSDFNTATTFAHYTNTGILHYAGTPLTIDSGQTISGSGYIADHVNCYGTLQSGGGLTNGLSIFGAASVSAVELENDDTISGMNSGNLSLWFQYVGYKSTGVFDQSGGCNSPGSVQSIHLNLYLGYNSGAYGTYNLSDTGSLNSRSETIGYSGVGTFNQTGGTNTILDFLELGKNSGSTGTYILNGGTLITGNISKGNGAAQFKFGGGTLQFPTAANISIPITLTGENGNANINVPSGQATLSGILSGLGGLNKLGSGILSLNAKNTYAGPTTISSGSLSLGGNASLASQSVNVADGATFNVSAVSGGFDLLASQTLKGSGKIVGNLTVHGIHAPGDSPGIETVQGNYNMLGQLQIELDGTTPGTGYDQVLISGTGPYNATLAGTLALDWIGLSGSSGSTRLWIFENDTAGTLSGAFSNYANGSFVGNYDGRDWFIWYGANAATGYLAGGNDVVIAAVPEPGVISLLLPTALLIGLGFIRRYFLKCGLQP
jgi:autotransporter-associated beta strand protein